VTQRTIIADADAMLTFGAGFAATIERLGGHELFIELQGDLGAGKTVFVRGLARRLGVPAEVPVASPTFVVARSYRVHCGSIRVLHHIDAYRLRGAADLDAAGFEEMCGSGCLTCVEWGEKVALALPEDRVRVRLLSLPPEAYEPGEAPVCAREALVEGLGPRARAFVEAWAAAPEEGA